MAAILDPEKPQHRSSLGQNFHKVVTLPHVDIIDVNKDPIIGVTDKEIRLESSVVKVDVVILATGLDSVTASPSHLNIQGTSGGTTADCWKNRIRTSMNIAISEFPNYDFPPRPSNSNRVQASILSHRLLHLLTLIEKAMDLAVPRFRQNGLTR